MTFLYFFSFFQITFLPGYLFLRFFSGDSTASFLEKLILSFGLSLIINYLLVEVLVFLEIYNRVILCIIAGLEIALLCFSVYRRVKHNGKPDLLLPWINQQHQKIINFFLEEVKVFRQSKKLFERLVSLVPLFIFALSIIYIFLHINTWISSSDLIFRAHDAVVSWNRWANDWYNGIFPLRTWHYPQLLPANWSISYVFAGEPLQFIPKFTMGLYTVYTLLMLTDLFLKTNRLSFPIASIVLLIVLTNGFPLSRLFDGFAEMPIIFFAFGSLYCLFNFINQPEEINNLKYLFLGTFFSMGCAATKQAGLFIAVLYPVLAIIFLKQQNLKPMGSTVVNILIVHIISAIVIILPFYLMTELRIAKGLDISEIKWVTEGIYAGKSFLQRLPGILNLIEKMAGGKTELLILIFLFFISLVDRHSRWISLLITAPFVAIWARFYSYDIRNIALALPFFCLGVGVGVEKVYSWLMTFARSNFSMRFSTKLQMVSLLHCLLLIPLAATTLIAINWDELNLTSLTKHQDTFLRLKLGNAALNRALYSHFAKKPCRGKILTNYRFLYYLPGFKDCYAYQPFSKWESEVPRFHANIKLKDVSYILITRMANKTIIQEIQNGVKNKKFKKIFDHKNYIFVKIHK